MPRILLDLQTLQSDSRHRGIGNYSRGLADALLRRPGIEWHVLLSDAMPGQLLEAQRWARQRVDPRAIHVLSGIGPTRGRDPGNNARARAAEALYAGFVSALAVDLVHVASPFDGWGDETIVDVAPVGGTAHAATVYDLIPFEEPELFLPTPDVSGWYHHRLNSLRRVEVALAISDHTRSVVCDRLGLPEAQVVSIGADVDPVFAPRTLAPEAARALKARYGITRPFVIHVGIPEPRKNVARLIEALAALPELRDSHQIVLATAITAAQRANVGDLIQRLKLPADAVVMPGFVPDDDLAALYGLAEVAVMPSLNEGFGLPLLEAMRCGCPVLGSNTTSIPQVVGRADLTFDPAQTSAISERLHQILTDRAFRAGAIAHALAQQARFSWDSSAALACAAFKETLERRSTQSRPAIRTLQVDLAGLAPARYRLALSLDLNDLGPSDTDPGDTEPNDTGARVPVPLPDEAAARQAVLVAEGPALILDVREAGARQDGTDADANRVSADGAGSGHTAQAPSPNALATFRPDGDATDGGTLSWHGFPRTRRGPPPPQIWSTATAALGEVLAVHPLARITEPLARLRPLTSEGAPSDTVPVALSAEDRVAIARALADNHAPAQPRPRLLVDISELALRDARSGIQRVVRNILRALLDAPGDLDSELDFDVVPIRREGAEYRYARAFTARFLDVPALGPDAIVDFRATDTVLGLDFDATIPPAAVANLQRQHLRGVRFVHVVYDTLPLHRPDWFPNGLFPVYHQWLHTLAALSDGIACISQAVADDLAKVLVQRRILQGRSVAIRAFHLGADLDADLSSQAAPIPEVVDATHAHATQDPDLLFESGAPVFVTVGTLEPRKGHAQLLDAADCLWAAGSPAIIAIVGKRGWLSDALIHRIETHPELGRRLRWFEASSDAVLHQVYRSATAVLLPSEGEGFGLPLVEAAHVGLPILARDLPVFREIGGAHATYFTGFDGASLAQAIEDWLAAHAAGRTPDSGGIVPLTWADSARQLMAFLHTVPHQP